jgi:hypothetical protein
MGIRADLAGMIQAFERDGGTPTKICLTRDDERRLAAMNMDEAGGTTTGNPRNDYYGAGSCLGRRFYALRIGAIRSLVSAVIYRVGLRTD